MLNMKDSGIEWIGAIPRDWEVRKMKSVLNLYTGNSIKDEEKSYYEDSYDAIPYIATKDINVDTSKANYKNGMYVKKENRSFKRAKENSILLCIEGGSAGRKITYLNETVCFINKLCCFDPKNINSKYTYYYLKSPSFIEEFNNNISGLIGGVSIGKLNNFVVSYPPLSTQQRIANYLDNKCAKIDSTIEKTKTTIEEYKRLKYAMVSDAVTKGISNNIVNSSKIDWIGKVPTHWKTIKLKYLFLVNKRIANSLGHDVLSVTQTGLKIKNLLNNEGQVSSDYSKYQIVNPNDFVMNHMDLLTGWVDYSEFSGVTSPDYRVFTLDREDICSKDYYLYIFQLCYKHKIFFGLGQGVSNLGRWRLQTDKFINFELPLPPLEEQQAIVNYLDQKCAEIDTLITKKQTIITELESYKKSLIYECVTGKMEV